MDPQQCSAVQFSNNSLGVWDYVVFSVVLAVSAGIGLFYGCTGGKNKTTGEYLMANRQVRILQRAQHVCKFIADRYALWE